MTVIRQQTEGIEALYLHPKAGLSANSAGRSRPEKSDPLRTCYQRDRDRIIHSKAFRRLMHKTQVFFSPMGDHYRTRLTHVLEVSQIARTIARALRLNEDLTEAIALGHDLGHTPFGHAGEAVLNELHPGGFRHYEQSLRVVDFLEKKGRGLNLTSEVRDGILRHSKGKGVIIPVSKTDRAGTLEAQIVRVADVIAYINHDLDDSIRAGVLRKSDIPARFLQSLGESHSARINTMVGSLIEHTLMSDLDDLSMAPEVMDAVSGIKEFLFERVYEDEKTKSEFTKTKKILHDLYSYYLDHIDEVFRDIPRGRGEDNHRLVCDFIAGMTDRFALATYERLFMPEEWKVF